MQTGNAPMTTRKMIFENTGDSEYPIRLIALRTETINGRTIALVDQIVESNSKENARRLMRRVLRRAA